MEFATRQTLNEEDDAVVGLSVSGMTNHQFNGHWVKRNFSHDGQPVYSQVYRGTTFYFYFRQNPQPHWVLDDLITSSGSVFSESLQGDMNSFWSTDGSWEVCRTAKLALEQKPRGEGI